MSLPNIELLKDELRTVLYGNCTGQDDHDEPRCRKCEAMEEELLRAVLNWYQKKGE